jgi:hypothetical protein
MGFSSREVINPILTNVGAVGGGRPMQVGIVVESGRLGLRLKLGLRQPFLHLEHEP